MIKDGIGILIGNSDRNPKKKQSDFIAIWMIVLTINLDAGVPQI